jgi:hypothetical protein
VCVFLCFRTGRGLATSWSPVQGVVPTVLDLVTEVKRKFSWRRPRPELGCRAKGGKMDVIITQQRFVHLFIHQWLYIPSLCPGLFFSFVLIFTQTVGLLERVISPPQDRYLHTRQHKHGINADIHALSGIRTHDPNVRAREIVHVFNSAATVIGQSEEITVKNYNTYNSIVPNLVKFWK